MTPQEIRTAILASSTLRAAIESGQDEQAAKELNRSQPKESVALRLDELGLLELYAQGKYTDAMSVLTAIRASAIPLAQLVTKFMQPGAVRNPDFGTNAIRKLLTDAAPNGLALANATVKPILDAGTIEKRVTTNDISDAVSAWRPEGKIGPIPEGAS